MNRIIKIFYIFLIAIILITNISIAESNLNDIKYKTINIDIEDINEEYKMYILLPEEYIKFVIGLSKQNIKYEGIKTLKENDIIGLDIKKENIQDEFYNIDQRNYVKIYLNASEKNNYQFKIRDEYFSMDIKFLISINNKDYMVMHIDNFKYNNEGICKIVYNYKKNTLKNEVKNRGKISIWQILIVTLIIIVTMYIINKIKSKEN